MDEMYLIPMQQQVQAARKELRECNEYSSRFGLALREKDARSLRMGNAEQEELLYLLESKTLEQRRQLLRGAALKLCGELETGDAWSRGYAHGRRISRAIVFSMISEICMLSSSQLKLHLDVRYPVLQKLL